jgi:flagellar basal body-associated protein FliL
MADEDKKEEGAEGVAPKKGNGKIGMLIGVIVGVIVLQAALAFLVVNLTAPKTEIEETEEVVDSSQVVKQKETISAESEVILPTSIEKIVNISGTDGTRFLKFRAEIAYDGSVKTNSNVASLYATMMVRINSKFNEYLSSLTLENVQDRNAQQNISEDLLRECNSLLPINSGRFSNIYVTEFILQ